MTNCPGAVVPWYRSAFSLDLSSFLTMSKNPSPHLLAALQALLVTFLWSTSWVLIKIGLEQVPPLTFAGLRYGLAAMLLLPFAFRRGLYHNVRRLDRAMWLRLILLGILFYAATQGSQFLGLAYLPAVTVNLLLTFTSVVVAVLSIPLLKEVPRPVQWLGIGIAVMGAVIYFHPIAIPAGQSVGYLAAIVGLFSNAGSTILGREINRSGQIDPLFVTVVSMAVGAVVLMTSGIVLQGMPELSWASWLIIAWLAVVNTAFAFTLWNRVLQTLSAVESSIINNTMLIQIPILAVIFLGETLTRVEVLGLVVAGVGTFMVQLGRRRKAEIRD